MEAYFWVFINFKQNNWARLLLIAEFIYNNVKNASFSYILFKLNCGYYPQMSYKKDINPQSKSKSIDELLVELKKLIIVCQKNLYHAQEL